MGEGGLAPQLWAHRYIHMLSGLLQVSAKWIVASKKGTSTWHLGTLQQPVRNTMATVVVHAFDLLTLSLKDSVNKSKALLGISHTMSGYIWQDGFSGKTAQIQL